MAIAGTVASLTTPGQSGKTAGKNDLWLDQYGGAVERVVHDECVLWNQLDKRTVIGASTITDHAIGKSGGMQALTPGQGATASAPRFGNYKVTVEKGMILRNAVFTLDEIQNDYSIAATLGEENGMEMAEYLDMTAFIMALKAAHATVNTLVTQDGQTITDLPGYVGATQVNLAAVGDETDPDKFVLGLQNVILGMQNKKIDPAKLGMKVYVRPERFWTLLNHEKLVNVQFSDGNAKFSSAILKDVGGLEIVTTLHLPKAAVTDHVLGANYNLSADMALAEALIIEPKRALFVGESIPVRAETWRDNDTKSDIIDCYTAVGAALRRVEYAGVLRRKTA